MKILFPILAIALITGCASSKFQYQEPAEAYKGKPLVLNEVIVDIDLTSAKQPAEYMTEEQMEDLLKSEIIRLTSEYDDISFDATAVDGLKAVINVDYLRVFSYGDSIAKPKFSGKVDIMKKDTLLGSRSFEKSTTSMGGAIANAAVNAQVGVGKWDEKDEPRDIEAVGITFVKIMKKF
ncbi:MAG: hypothetical protein P1U57_05095 [Oleibacter sp.]|nr:hypothetical protein [Thalassolituus sp.]